MLSEEEFITATKEAYKFVNSIELGSRPAKVLAGVDTHKEAVNYVWRIAERAGHCKVVFSKTIANQIKKGFGSWLAKYESRIIAVNGKQLKDWALLQHPKASVGGGWKSAVVSRLFAKDVVLTWEQRYSALVVRSILHELGHILLQPELLDDNAINRSATPQQEEAPWVFAMTTIGILLGEYARMRRGTDDVDDSPSIPV